MKLAEALVLRADIQSRINELRERLKESVLIQEGDQPPEDPQILLTELDRLIEQLTQLVFQINRTNIQTLLDDGRSITEALAERDGLRLRHSILRSVAARAANRLGRYSRSEIRQISTVDIAVLRQSADQLAQQFRVLDTTIQSVNWAKDLI